MVIISYPSPSKALVGASFNVTAGRLLRETATVCIPHRHRWQSCYTSFCIWGSCLFFMCSHRIFGSQKGETRDRIGLKSFLDLAYCQFPYWTALFSDFHWWRSVKKKPRHPHWHQPHHQDSGRLRLGCDSLQGDTTLVKKMPKRIQISSTSTSIRHPYSILVPPLRQFWISRLHEPINWGSSGSRFFHLISNRETGLCQTSLPNLGWTSKRVHHFLRSSPWNLALAFPVIWRMNPPKQRFVAVGEIAGMVILPKIKLPRLHLYTPRDFHVKEES